MCKLLSKRISTIVLVIILCITLNLCAFAASDIDDIKLDGIVTDMEWGRNSVINFKSYNFDNNVSFTKMYLIADEGNDVFCFGFNVSEKSYYNRNSAVQLVFDGSKRIIISSQNVCKNYGGLTVESKTYKNMPDSYSLELKIKLAGLDSGTTVDVSFIDSNNVMSNKFYINRKKMTANISNMPEQTTNKSSTTKKYTTKKSSTKNRTSKKDEKRNNNKDENEEHQGNKNSKTKYIYEHTTNSKTSGQSKIKTPNCFRSNNNDTVNINKGNSNDGKNVVEEVTPKNNSDGDLKVKKIIITTVASIMIIIAVSLPIVKNVKNKKTENKKE